MNGPCKLVVVVVEERLRVEAPSQDFLTGCRTPRKCASESQQCQQASGVIVPTKNVERLAALHPPSECPVWHAHLQDRQTELRRAANRSAADPFAWTG